MNKELIQHFISSFYPFILTVILLWTSLRIITITWRIIKVRKLEGNLVDYVDLILFVSWLICYWIPGI